MQKSHNAVWPRQRRQGGAGVRLGSPGAWTVARPWASQDKDSEGPAHSAGSPLGAVYVLNKERKARRQRQADTYTRAHTPPHPHIAKDRVEEPEVLITDIPLSGPWTQPGCGRQILKCPPNSPPCSPAGEDVMSYGFITFLGGGTYRCN